MITYDMGRRGERPLYEYLYLCIRGDIESGTIAPNEKLPSKRHLAQHLGVSLITVEGAYTQLVAEGYIKSVERRGYYANLLPQTRSNPWRILPTETASAIVDTPVRSEEPPRSDLVADFRGGSIAKGTLPYDLWARALRAVLAEESEESLAGESDFQGSMRLRNAIAAHLHGFRGMEINPDQVFIGAGAQYLYHMLVQLLGRDRTVAVEDPGYPRLAKIYSLNGVQVRPVPLDGQGISLRALQASGADVAHIMPSHQYPTGQTTSISRRYELLAWAAEKEGRVIVEDDYDCEFRLAGRPIPSLQSIDASDRVIYANTFTKTLGPGFRLGYLVLPPSYASAYRENLSFYSCTVSAVDQLALARFIESGSYERHVNRMRSHYRDVQNRLVGALRSSSLADRIELKALESGLHFLMGVEDGRPSEEIAASGLDLGIALLPLDRFRLTDTEAVEGPLKWFVMNFAGISLDSVQASVDALERVFRP